MQTSMTQWQTREMMVLHEEGEQLAAAIEAAQVASERRVGCA